MRTLTTARITNAADALAFLQEASGVTDLRNVYLLDSSDCMDIVEASLIEERLTDGSHVHNVLLTLREIPLPTPPK